MAIDTIDVLDVPSKVWGVAAAPSILSRLDPGLNQTGMTAAQAAIRLDSMNRLPTVAFVTTDQAAAQVGAIEADRVLTAVGMRPIGQLQPGVIATTPPGVTVTTSPGRLTTTPLSPIVVGPGLTTLRFQLPAPTVTLLKQQMTDVAKVIIDRQIVGSDAASLPQTSLAGGFESLRQTIVAALDPAVTVVRMVNHRISALSDAQAEGLDDIMAAPDLSEPTYQALAAISHDWLLPGIDTLPSGTTTLVESNRTFISAFSSA